MDSKTLPCLCSSLCALWILPCHPLNSLRSCIINLILMWVLYGVIGFPYPVTLKEHFPRSHVLKHINCIIGSQACFKNYLVLSYLLGISYCKKLSWVFVYDRKCRAQSSTPLWREFIYFTRTREIKLKQFQMILAKMVPCIWAGQAVNVEYLAHNDQCMRNSTWMGIKISVSLSYTTSQHDGSDGFYTTRKLKV